MSNGNRSNGSTSPQEPEILTLKQVADWLQIRPREVVRLGVPHSRLGRKTLRFVREKVLRWLEEKQTSNKKGRQGL